MEAIKKIYYRLYFRIYSFTYWTQKDDTPFFSTFYLAFLEFIFLASILILVGKLSNIKLFPHNGFGSLLLGVFIFIINYLIFLRKRKYLLILSKFKPESKIQKIYSGIITLGLLILGGIFLLKTLFFRPGIW